MASDAQPKKSKWGVSAFLQQAVSGVESRLDVILANEDDLPPKRTPQKHSQIDDRPPNVESPVRPTTSSTPRSSSTARKNDRLQERLARAVVRPPSSIDVPSRTTSPLSNDEARPSLESAPGALEDATITIRQSIDEALPMSPSSRKSHDSMVCERESKESSSRERDEASNATVAENADDQAEALENKHELDEVDDKTDAVLDSAIVAEVTDDGSNSTLAELQAEHQAAEQRWQEEMHGHVERIDALQSKLKYLARETAESARKAASSAEAGSLEKQLLEKEERIALLLEEGQKLSKTELDNRSIIKKLRQQLAENNKFQVEVKKRSEKLEKDRANTEARARRAEARANEALWSQSKFSKELESIKAERNALSATLDDVKGQLARALARAESAEAKAQSDAVEQSRRRILDLEDDLSSAKIERELSEEKLRREIRDLKDNLEREKENARVLQAELKGEQSVLESKMESLRTRAEEVSSSTAGDAQAKLLRQIEILQSQYAVASENWQGIETSLLSRLASMEKERDEIVRKEADLRRKARDLNTRAKKAEEELENVKESNEELQRNLQDSNQELKKLKQRNQQLEESLESMKKDFTEQQKSTEALWSQKLDEERLKWREQVNSSTLPQHPRTDSLAASSRKSSGLDPTAAGPDNRPMSRRSSFLPIHSPDIITPPRQNSYPSFSQISGSPYGSGFPSNGTQYPMISESPSIHTFEPEEDFTGLAMPPTPSTYGGQTVNSRGINDIISVSTVGAGPSVQLVERMSAAVRRLESERAASKDELTRITSQRDEARQEVVELMKEVEEKRALDTKVQELESQVQELDQRYQTTLELLGEKSEQVDELQADIADVKKIYRELVDSTMK